MAYLSKKGTQRVQKVTLLGQIRVSVDAGISEDFGEPDEDTEIKNLLLYTERKADCIYRYRRRVPKTLVERVVKGYLYRNLGRTKKDVVGNWPKSHANVEATLDGAQASAEKSAEPNNDSRPSPYP